MNWFALFLHQLTDGRSEERGGSVFKGVSFVKVVIDGQELEEMDAFRDSLVYFDELARSAESSGRYLIFTCTCGIAEDGGWEGVNVDVTESTVSWELEVGAERLRFTFDHREYVSEIESVKAALGSSPLPLEPRAVIFPQGFKR
ncbi:hypothetical protein F0U61_44505 [Archangium violaceum]|uniref:hypothetical protein n=1 Tax=Archangium violaceum TaxID=83451 RepID=UPI002B2BEB3E|nr:hypothetical protein F0U61_44505 [Archangium violaceum]